MARRPTDQVAADDGYYEPEGDLDAAATRIEREDEIYQSIPDEPPRLIIIGGNNRGQEYALCFGDNSIGRGLENDIVVADIAVSRKHTLVCAENNQFIVRDLGSGNGTLVNGQRTGSQVLVDGDQIEIGKTMLRFHWQAPVAQAAPPMEMPAAMSAPMAPPAFTGPPQFSGAPTEPPMAGQPMPGQPMPGQPMPGQPMPGQPMASQPAAQAYYAGSDYAGSDYAGSDYAGSDFPGPDFPGPGFPGPATSATATETDGARRPGLSARSRKLLIFGGVGLVALFGGLFALKLVLKKKPAADAQVVRPTVSPDELAARHFEEGTNQYRARNWEEARKHYLKVLAVAPSFDRAKRYADQAAAEITARDALQRAKTAIAAKDFTSARKELSQIPSSSSYATESRAMKQKLDDAQVEQLLKSARLLEDSGDVEDALTKVNEALKIAPTNQTVRSLHARLSGQEKRPPAAKRPPRVARRPTRRRPARRAPRRPAAQPSARPIRVGGGAKAAIARYRRKEWGPAYEAAKDVANSLGGRRKKSAKALADTIRKVGQSVLRAQKVQSSAPGKAVGYYQTALSLDRKVPGRPHQGWLKGMLQKVVRFQANSAMARGRYVEAYQAIRKWKKHGSVDAAMKRVLKQLDGKAKQLFTKAYTIRTSNPSKARRMWQQVLKMVPPSSTAYQKSYSWLNNSAPRYQDEDED